MPQISQVSLESREIRFPGCDSHEAKVIAVEKRLVSVADQLAARSGVTNRERRALSREANMLRRWLSPDGNIPPRKQRRQQASVSNLQRRKRRKLTKRERREVRKSYRERTPIQVWPDYSPQVISVDQLEAIRRVMHAREAKEDWFTKKQQPLLIPVASL
jgi:hypothetical protein